MSGEVIPLGIEPPMPFSERPGGPECECTEYRAVLPCDWGWRCGVCSLPVPRASEADR